MFQVFPPDEVEQVCNKDDMKTSLRKVVKEVGVRIAGGEALRGRQMMSHSGGGQVTESQSWLLTLAWGGGMWKEPHSEYCRGSQKP